MPQTSISAHYMEGEIIFKDEEFYLIKKLQFTDEIIDLFDSTIWGEKGALYEHKDTKTRLAQIRQPVQVELRSVESDELAGTCVLVNRTVNVRDKEFDFYFMRYLVAGKKYRGKGILRRYAGLAMGRLHPETERPTVYIGIVEEFNSKSMNLVKSAGYVQIAAVKTLSFSRFFPKLYKTVTQVSNDTEKNEIRDLLNAHYYNHSLYHQENIFLNNEYYYIRKDGEIVAGLQAYPALWVVKKLPGWSGKIMHNIIPYIPLINKVFNPRKFEFLAYDGIFYKNGHLEDLYSLCEHVLAKNNLKSSLFWLDERSKSCQELLKFGKLGLLHKSGAATHSFIMMRFHNVSEEDKKLFFELPVYQSGFDFI
jgi:hypothetical protein